MILYTHICHPDRMLDKQDQLWSHIGQSLTNINGILVISPFWLTKHLMFGTTQNAPIQFDFEIRNPRIKRLGYRSNRSPFLVELIRSSIDQQLFIGQKPSRGLDHGAWVPIRMLYPSDTVSVVQLSWVSGFESNELFIQSIRQLIQQNILIVCSGQYFHPYLTSSFLSKTGSFNYFNELDHDIDITTSHGQIVSLFNTLRKGLTLKTLKFIESHPEDQYSGELVLSID